MVVTPRYSHHRHTGKLRPHHETSYALLAFLVILTGVVLTSFSLGASAATTGGGTVEVLGVVPQPRPTTPAIITSPVNGQVFTGNPVTVEGTCPDKALIKIFKNGILAGSVICGPSRRFSIPIDLVVGRNDLTALPYNVLDEPGPVSPTVTVTLNLPPGGFGFSSELILQSVNFYRGSLTGRDVTWPIEIVGGQAPYAVSVNWGDGTSDLITRLAPGPFTVSHTYKNSGRGYLNTFPLIIRATDAAGHTAYLQLTTIVNDPTGANSNVVKGSTQPRLDLAVLWPLWIVALLLVLSFWLGERREKKIMERRLAATA